MSYRIEILVRGEWRSVCDSSGEAYSFGAFEPAAAMMRLCYPDQVREHRFGGPEVVRVRENPADVDEGMPAGVDVF